MIHKSVPALLLAAAMLIPGGAAAGDELEESLRQAELAFAASVAARDRDAFAAMLAEETVFASGELLRGKAAVLQAWAVFFQDDGPRLTWHPEVAAVQDGGELGLTRGPYTLSMVGEDGEPLEQKGTFTSVWRRQQDGSWRIVFDSGCPPCACDPASPVAD